ncbi:MAG: 4-hydroxy-3-methylbut-2-enyl diphosphate reductase [Treponema sp.]|nr:4-hydroxy-3-methylbut-2-enyl diphosphate reductase [Treponema sp.]
MEVIRAAFLGFCMGVRRAVELAVAEAEHAGGAPSAAKGRVYTLGPLIHNPRVLSDLENLGVEILKNPSRQLAHDAPDGSTLIIRAHGITCSLEEDLRSRGYRVVDATCPRVKASQLAAKKLTEAGCRLFLAGEASHAEIEGIVSYAGAGFCEVVENAEEAQTAAAKLYEREKDARTALIGQTTISPEEYVAVGEAIKKYFPALEIVPTICAATRDRLQSLEELLEKVDAVIIAGGRESANTRRLLAMAHNSGKPCVIAESAKDIPMVLYAFETVGLAAGASTPDSVIEEIERELKTAVPR